MEMSINEIMEAIKALDLAFILKEGNFEYYELERRQCNIAKHAIVALKFTSITIYIDPLVEFVARTIVSCTKDIINGLCDFVLFNSFWDMMVAFSGLGDFCQENYAKIIAEINKTKVSELIGI